MTQPAPHVVLLGDSVFDNARYVAPGPDVAAQLRAVLPAGWRATLRAVDGATTSGLAAQLRAIPADATHLVVSVGGNDALQNRDLLSLRVTSTAQALDAFARRLQVQERLTEEVASAIDTHLNPLGVAVVIEAHHSCMSCRGVRKPSAKMVTSALRGAFKTDPSTRAEFYQLVRGR